MLLLQGELFFLGLAQGIPDQQLSGGMYDWELAEAAQATLLMQVWRQERWSIGANGGRGGAQSDSTSPGENVLPKPYKLTCCSNKLPWQLRRRWPRGPWRQSFRRLEASGELEVVHFNQRVSISRLGEGGPSFSFRIGLYTH